MNCSQGRLSVRGAAMGVLLCGLLTAIVPLAAGQSSSVPVRPEQGSVIRRFSIGARVSILGQSLFQNQTMSQSTTQPVTSTTYTSTSKSSRGGIGPTIEFNASRRVQLSVDLIYHRFGYEAVTSLVEGTDDTSTAVDERRYTTTAESTRGSFWDIPAVIRVAPYVSESDRFKLFFEAGYALRYARHITTSSRTVNPDNSTIASGVPAQPLNRKTNGAVVGMGVRVLDDFGIKFTPQVRFTRWFSDTFSSPVAQSRRNQIEVLLGFTF